MLDLASAVPNVAPLPNVLNVAPLPNVPNVAPLPNVPNVVPLPNVPNVVPLPNVPNVVPLPNVLNVAPLPNVPILLPYVLPLRAGAKTLPNSTSPSSNPLQVRGEAKLLHEYIVHRVEIFK